MPRRSFLSPSPETISLPPGEMATHMLRTIALSMEILHTPVVSTCSRRVIWITSLDLILNAPANSKTCVLGNPAISNFFSLPSETKLTYPRELHGVKTTPLSMYTIVNKFQFCSHTVWMFLRTVDSRAPPFLWLNSIYCWHKLFFSFIIIFFHIIIRVAGTVLVLVSV